VSVKRDKYVVACVLFVVWLVISAPLFNDYVVTYGNAMIWPGIFAKRIVENLLASSMLFYRVAWMGIQALMLITTYVLVSSLSEQVVVRGVATVLYATSPYHIYVCYNQGNMGRALCFSLIPLVVYACNNLSKKQLEFSKILVGSIAYGICIYADAILAIIFLGFACIFILSMRKVRLILPFVGGCALGFAELLTLVRYLLNGVVQGQELPLYSIMPSGYTIGRFFSAFYVVGDNPGLGVALLGMLLVCIWQKVMAEQKKCTRISMTVVMCLFLSCVMALEVFPWDVLQRVHAVFLRFVPLIGELNVFVGIISLWITLLAVPALESMWKDERAFVRYVLPGMVFVAAVGVALYQCNMITFYTYPIVE